MNNINSFLRPLLNLNLAVFSPKTVAFEPGKLLRLFKHPVLINHLAMQQLNNLTWSKNGNWQQQNGRSFTVKSAAGLRTYSIPS